MAGRCGQGWVERWAWGQERGAMWGSLDRQVDMYRVDGWIRRWGWRDGDRYVGRVDGHRGSRRDGYAHWVDGQMDM